MVQLLAQVKDLFQMQNSPMNFNVKGQKFSEKISDSTFQLTLKKPPLSECLCFIKEKSQNLPENDISKQ